MTRIEELRALRKREREAFARHEEACEGKGNLPATVYEHERARLPLEKVMWDSIDALLDCAEALKYARRFLNSKDHDVAYVDAALAKLEGRE